MSLKTGSVFRFFEPPSTSFFLFGPRGTGKSTLVRAAYPKALWVDLLDPGTFHRYQAHPERLRERVEAAQKPSVIVIDEIQKIPEMLDVVHSLIEEKRGYQFVLTGSSARKLRKAGTNLLGGRALRRTLHPFMAAELGRSFDLSKALRVGLLPLVWGATDPEDLLKSYVALYVREEVQMEGLVRQISHFHRFLEAISFSHGSQLNLSNISQECGVDAKTVQNYVWILRDLLLADELPVFTKRAKRELVSHSKFYFFDAGVFRSLRPMGPLDHPNELDGHALEGLVGQHLRAWNDYSGSEQSLSYWRTRSGNEVDFVVYGPRGFWAIEVKKASRIQDQDLRGLAAFKDDYPESTPLLLYRGKERLKRKNILCLPIDEFLLGLKPGRPLI